MFENNESVLPKYHQIKKFIIDYIIEKGIKEGDALPSENEIVSYFETSREPVRHAYKELEKEGVLVTVHGKGTFLKSLPNKRKKQLVCVISPYGRTDVYKGISKGIDNYAQTKHYSTLLLNSNSKQKNEIGSLHFIKDKNISGLIIEPVYNGYVNNTSPVLKMLADLSMPIVVINCVIKDLNFPTVAIDDEKYGYMATEYLITRNHTRIALVSNDESTAGQLRVRGYRRALAEHGIPVDEKYIMIYTSNKIIGKRHPSTIKTKELLLMTPPPSAIFFFDDHDAFIGMQAIVEEGYSVPDDISVIGFDDIEEAHNFPIPLTTIAHPKEKMGFLAAQLLIDEIENPGSIKNQLYYLDAAIVERESVKML